MKKDESFKLKYLTLYDEEFKEKLNVSFVNNESNSNSHFSIIISPNGTGKSRLLRLIVEIFNDLHNKSKNLNYNFNFKSKYDIGYQVSSFHYHVAYFRGEIAISRKNLISGELVSIDISEMKLPLKLTASSYSLSDKFPTQNNRIFGSMGTTRYDNDFYLYLGTRTYNNMSTSSGAVNRVIDRLVDLTNNKEDIIRIKEINQLFTFLEYKPVIEVNFRLSKNRDLLSGRITRNTIIKKLNELAEKSSEIERSKFLTIVNDVDAVTNTLDYINRVNGIYHKEDKISLKLDFSNFKNFFTESSQLKSLLLLKRLEVLRYDSIFIGETDQTKSNNKYSDIRHLSSGESSIIVTLIGLLCCVEHNSLIIIDEPEISLHPNWQLEYLPLLKKALTKYKGCHVLVATHSHLLVTHIDQGNGSVLSVNLNKSTSSIINHNTWGWDSERILYDVFGLATASNKYFERDIYALLKLININSNDLEKIKKITEKLSAFILNEEDPLRYIINSSNEYVKKKAL